MSSNKIYLKIPIGVIYYVCDPRTPRLNLYITQHAEDICDWIWRRLIEKMPEIKPLGGLHLLSYNQYTLPLYRPNNLDYKVVTTHALLSDRDKQRLKIYIGDIQANQSSPYCIDACPMFFFRCPHPAQARFGFNTKRAMKKEYFGETVFIQYWPGDLPESFKESSEFYADEIYEFMNVILHALFNHWNRPDIGITRENALKYAGVEDPHERFEEFKKAVWKAEAFIRETKYLNSDIQEFGFFEDEFLFDKIIDPDGNELKLSKTDNGRIVTLDIYTSDIEWPETIDGFPLESRIFYSQEIGFTNALFRLHNDDINYENPIIDLDRIRVPRFDLFSYFFTQKEDQNNAIDDYLKLASFYREETRNQLDRLVERIKSCDNTQKTENSNKANKANEVKEVKLNFQPLHFFNEELFNTDERKQDLRNALLPIIKKQELKEALPPDFKQVETKQDWYAVLRGAQSVAVKKDKLGKWHKVLSEKKTPDVAMFEDLCMLMPELAEDVNIFPINDTIAEDGKEAKATSSEKYKTLRKALSEERKRWTIKDKGELFVQDWEKTEYIPSTTESITGKRINNKKEKYDRMFQIGKKVKEALEQLRDKYIQS